MQNENPCRKLLEEQSQQCSLIENTQGSIPIPEFKGRHILKMQRVCTSVKGQRKQSVHAIHLVCHLLLCLWMVLCHIRMSRVTFLCSLQQSDWNSPSCLFCFVCWLLSFYFFCQSQKLTIAECEIYNIIFYKCIFYLPTFLL